MRDTSAVLGCGVVLLVSLAAVSRLDARVETAWFLWLVGVGAVAYLAALVLVARGLPPAKGAVAICLLLAVIWRIALMSGAPLASDDVYRYVWDGRVQQHGVNPYLAAPDDPTFSSLHTSVTRMIDPSSAALPTIYPPAAELFFRAVIAVHESVEALVLAVLLCDLLIIYVLWRWLVSMGRSPWWVLAYAWHPLVAVEGAGGGHIDFVGTLFVVSAAYALSRGKGLLAASALALAFSVKLLPLVLTPLLWRRVSSGQALAAVGVVLALYLPFLDGAGPPVGSLGTYAAQWRFNGPLFGWLESQVGLGLSVAITVGSGLAVAAAARARLPVSAPEAWAWPMATTLLFMPAVYPWYLVWVVPFLGSRGTWPLMAWSLGVPLTYAVWISESTGLGWVLPPWVQPVEYAALVIGGVAVWTSVRRRPAGSFAS